MLLDEIIRHGSYHITLYQIFNDLMSNSQVKTLPFALDLDKPQHRNERD